MSEHRIESSKHSSDLHDVPGARSQPSGEYLDRSMVAQLGNVPQPEQQDQQAQLAASITQQLAAEAAASRERAEARAAASRASIGASSSQLAGVGTIASFLGPAMDSDGSMDEPPLEFDLSDSPPKDRSVRRRTASSASRAARCPSPSPRPRTVPRPPQIGAGWVLRGTRPEAHRPTAPRVRAA